TRPHPCRRCSTSRWSARFCGRGRRPRRLRAGSSTPWAAACPATATTSSTTATSASARNSSYFRRVSAWPTLARYTSTSTFRHVIATRRTSGKALKSFPCIPTCAALRPLLYELTFYRHAEDQHPSRLQAVHHHLCLRAYVRDVLDARLVHGGNLRQLPPVLHG